MLLNKENIIQKFLKKELAHVKKIAKKTFTNMFFVLKQIFFLVTFY